MKAMTQRRKRVLQVSNQVPAVEHTYSQCKEVHTGDGSLSKCFLLGIGCQDAKDINKAMLG
jgi:hypothetical protein